MSSEEVAAIVGCTHAGTLAATVLRSLNSTIRILVFECTNTMSFLACGIHLAIQRTCPDLGSMFYSSASKLKELNIEVHDNTHVYAIDFEKKIIKTENMMNEYRYEFRYTKLLISTGSYPAIPPVVEGLDYRRPRRLQLRDLRYKYKRIFVCKTYHDAETLYNLKRANKVAILGSGHIGMELAWTYYLINSRVIVIDRSEYPLQRHFDNEYIRIIEEKCRGLRIELITQARVTSISERHDHVYLRIERVYNNTIKLQQIQVDYLILSTGFVPNIDVAEGSGILTQGGSILVDDRYRTSIPDVYAAGDCCSTFYKLIGKYVYMPSASHAIKHAIVAAFQMAGRDLRYVGTNNSTGIRLFDYSLASTGLNHQYSCVVFGGVSRLLFSDFLFQQYCEQKIDRVIQPIAVGKSFESRARSVRALADILIDSIDQEYVYEEDNVVSCIVNVRDSDNRILGCQVMGAHDVSQVANTVSVMLTQAKCVQDALSIDFGGMDGMKKPWGLLPIICGSRFIQICDFESVDEECDDDEL